LLLTQREALTGVYPRSPRHHLQPQVPSGPLIFFVFSLSSRSAKRSPISTDLRLRLSVKQSQTRWQHPQTKSRNLRSQSLGLRFPWRSSNIASRSVEVNHSASVMSPPTLSSCEPAFVPFSDHNKAEGNVCLHQLFPPHARLPPLLGNSPQV